MIKVLFPYQLYLHILQLEEYDLGRFLKWVLSNYTKRGTENKKKLVWTAKARIIYFLSLTLSLFIFVFLIFIFKFVGLLLGVLLITQAYLFISLATLLFLPAENIVRTRKKKELAQKLKRYKETKVIGISGSYGKTSTKMFLYHLLRGTYQVLTTPGSYNTLLGIGKVVEWELYDGYDFFICEMGAYKRGDIKEIAETVRPDMAILTGLNEQHYERFGSLDNAVKGEFELIESLSNSAPAFVNRDSELVRHNYEQYGKQFVPYGFSDEKNTIKDVHISEKGTAFTIVLDGKSYQANTSLIGNGHLTNILGAATVAHFLKVKPEHIIDRIATLKAVPHRFEVKELLDPHVTLIDDAYSSNPTGFAEALETLKQFNRPKVLVTPGIIELGDMTLTTHQSLGELADQVCDYIILIGEDNERLKGLEDGITNKEKIIRLRSITDMRKKVAELDLDHPIVLLENDLTDIY